MFRKIYPIKSSERTSVKMDLSHWSDWYFLLPLLSRGKIRLSVGIFMKLWENKKELGKIYRMKSQHLSGGTC